MRCFTYHQRCLRKSFGGSSWCPRHHQVLRRCFRLPIAAGTRCGWRRIGPGYQRLILVFRLRSSVGSGTDCLRRARRAPSALPDWTVLLPLFLLPVLKESNKKKKVLFVMDSFLCWHIFTLNSCISITNNWFNYSPFYDNILYLVHLYQVYQIL